MKFNKLNLNDKILKALEELKYEKATEIQQETIAHAIEGKDILAQAQTGTGKTAAFCLPILERITNEKKLQALILVPTRELAVQINDEVKKFSKYQKIDSISVYGGDPITKQIQLLREKPQIVVGTPGRVIDLIDRKKLKIHELDFFVLDEVDEMLNMGFIDDVKKIEKATPRDKQVLFFSATMPNKIKTLSNKFLSDFKDIKVDAKSLTVDKVEQYFIRSKDSRKFEALKNILDLRALNKIIIFTKTKRRADETYEFLHSNNYKIEKIHGDLDQKQRLKTINRLRNGEVNIIVATDVVARGIDIDGIELVINMQLPQDMEYYIHRIGRTGRAGNKGESITLVSENEYKKEFRHYPKKLKCDIKEMDMPKDDEIIAARMQKYYFDISSKLDEEIEDVYIELANMFDPVDLRNILAIELQENYPELSKSKRKKIIKKHREKITNGSGNSSRGNNGSRRNGRSSRGKRNDSRSSNRSGNGRRKPSNNKNNKRDQNRNYKKRK
ncbi:MAG: DEAD/DEAH box helicase [Mycoplasmatales bacterium]